MNKILVLFIYAQLVLTKSFTFKDQTNFFKSQLNITELPFYTETGYVGLDGKLGSTNKLFYHLFLKDGVKKLSDVKDDDNFAIWLNGGPGCTSLFGSYAELGPISIKTDPKDSSKQIISLREYSWNKIAHLLFVDQPFNVGLSYSDSTQKITNSDMAADYFIKFLQEFFTFKKEFSKTKFYIFGESYAGHFIPTIAAAFIKSDALKLTNFIGIAVGNGWTEAFSQTGTYGSFLYSSGVIDDYGRNFYQTQTTKSQSALLAKDYSKSVKEFNMINFDKITGGMNPNNIQIYGYLDMAYIPYVQKYLSQFEAPLDIKFVQRNEEVTNAFVVDILTPRVKEYEEILTAGYKVLLYNGQLDYRVNTAGVLAWVHQMKWQGLDQWKQQPKNIFTALNPATGQVETQGSYKYYANFHYATVYRAGHMVPTDNPTGAFALIDNFVNDKWKN